MENLAVQPLPTEPDPWQRVLSQLRGELNAGTFETWFQPTRYLSLEGTLLRIGVPNEMFAEWLRVQYLGTIRQTLAKLGLPGVTPQFVPPQKAQVPVGEPDLSPPARLYPRYTFDNFVVSSCNQFAHAACLAVTDQPGRTYNPLYIYGGVGLGKTHLMQAIGNRLLQTRPTLRQRYLTSEQFVNELISAIRFEDTPRFRERYRSVDILLVDDIQFLAGKESTQEEFFHTFNALHDSGKQIVITSDCAPRMIPSLEERLRSRFEWGLLADIQPPDLETKVAILNKMAAIKGWHLPSDVALFLAANIHSNIRELEGCLTTLMAQSSLRGQLPDLGMAREVVRTVIPQPEENVSMETVMRVVARHFNLSLAALRSRTNAQRIAFPRQVAMFLSKKLARESLPSIGLAFGGKHHTTVLHSIRKIEELRSKDLSIHKLLETLEEEMK